MPRMNELLINVLPEIQELEGVDFSAYNTPHIELLKAFKESGKRGLSEFAEFAGDRALVGRFLISVLQYLLIRYRRFEDESTEIPAFKLFLTLKGWLKEHGFEKDYMKLLHSFTGYIVEIAERIALRGLGIVYLEEARKLAIEAEETFGEEYFTMLKERAEKSLNALHEQHTEKGKGEREC